MADTQPPYRVEEVGEVLVVRLDNVLAGQAPLDQIPQALDTLIESRPTPRLVLDLSKVTHITSVSLGMMRLMQLKIERHGGAIRLCGLQPAVGEVLKVTRLDRRLRAEPTLKQAIEAVKAAPAG